VELINLTPGVAREMLDNASQEYVNAGTVARYARDITEGAFNGLASIITLGTGGKLLNGHHRCTAVCIAGRSIVVRVRRIEGDVYNHADQLRELAELAAADSAAADITRRLAKLIVAQTPPESPPDQFSGPICTWPGCDCLDPPCPGFWGRAE
jgi:hypothetical protein